MTRKLGGRGGALKLYSQKFGTFNGYSEYTMVIIPLNLMEFEAMTAMVGKNKDSILEINLLKL